MGGMDEFKEAPSTYIWRWNVWSWICVGLAVLIVMMGITSGSSLTFWIIGAIAVLLAAYSLTMDFEMAAVGVKNGAPQKYSWSVAFGLTVTLIWLYIEILRIVAILRGND